MNTPSLLSLLSLLAMLSLCLAEEDLGQRTTQIKIRQETPSNSKTNILNHFRPIISKLSPDTQDKVLIARADQEHGVTPHQTLAKVIQHNNRDSPYARTVVIQNTAQAFRAFGVKNIPQHILSSWARHKRRSHSKHHDEKPDDAASELDDDVI